MPIQSSLPRLAAWPVGLLLAAVIGALAGRSPSLALAAALTVGLIPIVFARYTLGVGLFILSTFFGLSATAQKGIGAVVVLAALVILAGSSREARARFFGAQKRLTLLLAAFLAWEFLTVVWAPSTSDVLYSLSRYAPNFLVFYVVAAAVEDRRDLITLVVFFVLGAA